MKKISFLILFCIHYFYSFSQSETFVYGDALPDAPELSPRGTYAVGVHTLDFINPNQVDVVKSVKGVDAFYDRKLKVEVWYPTDAKSDLITYDEVMGTNNDPKRPLIPFTFLGRAVRDAKIISKDGQFPLIIVSHGYVGSRFLMTYLTENLASKGYVVVAIDHTESTFRDAAAFTSTLLNRAKDIRFVLEQMAETNKSNTRFKGLIDTDNVGLIGYSMGGYGVLNVAGAGYGEAMKTLFSQFSGGSKAIEPLTYSSEKYPKLSDPRIKAVVAMAPWGMERSAWDSTSLKGLKTPTFFIAGDQDDISGYEKGIKAIFKGTKNAPRYMLTYLNARHNIAPNPAPKEALKKGLPFDEYYRYAEPSWDSRRINNINQHFVTAFMGIHLKKMDYQKFLDLPEKSNPKNWLGFPGRSSTGLELSKGIQN
jgi:predicted dienelactone hydrolase